MNYISNILLYLLLLIANNVFSQNLVKNGDFELIDKIPDCANSIHLAKGWYSINSSADLYHTCADPADFNHSYLRMEKPPSGYACACIFASEYETIQTKLSHPLEANKEYRVSFYIKMQGSSECALTPIFGLLTEYSSFDSIARYIHYEYQVSITDYKLLLDTKKWHQVSGTYLAKGNEKYLSIGYFNTLGKSFCMSIYLIDDVSVYPLHKEFTITQAKSRKDSIILDRGVILKLDYVSFDYNKSILLSNALPILDNLYEYLKENTDITIVIEGHTDNSGSKNINDKLSLERARAVNNYLVKRGIEKSRMIFYGSGSSKPLNDNSSEVMRQQNRRVEIKIN